MLIFILHKVAPRIVFRENQPLRIQRTRKNSHSKVVTNEQHVKYLYLTPMKSYWTCFEMDIAAQIKNNTTEKPAVITMLVASQGGSIQLGVSRNQSAVHHAVNGASTPMTTNHPNTQYLRRLYPMRNSISSTNTFHPVKQIIINAYKLLWFLVELKITEVILIRLVRIVHICSVIQLTKSFTFLIRPTYVNIIVCGDL